MAFGKQAQEMIRDPEVYRLFDAVAAKVYVIMESMEEKGRLAVAFLKDYTDGLLETMEGQLKPSVEIDSISEGTTDNENIEEKQTAEKFTDSQQLDCNLFTTSITD